MVDESNIIFPDTRLSLQLLFVIVDISSAMAYGRWRQEQSPMLGIDTFIAFTKSPYPPPTSTIVFPARLDSFSTDDDFIASSMDLISLDDAYFATAFR
jgi:hypothetical protein